MASAEASLSILTVARTLPWHVRGGMEEVTWKLARALADRGHELTVLTTAMDHEPATYERDGIEIHEIAYVPSWAQDWPTYRWWRFFGNAAADRADELGLDPDVVHCQSFYANGFLDRDPRPPVAATLHGTVYHHDYLGGAREKLIEEKGRWHPRRLLQWLDVRWRSWRENRQLAELDAIVPVSRVVVDMLETVPDDDPRVTVIPNGIDPDEFAIVAPEEARERLSIPASQTVVLYLGRMDRSKGIERLLDVAERVDARLHVAGDGPDLAWFREEVRARGLEEEVAVHGRVSDGTRNQLYAAADLFCLPSLTEAFGMVLLEAMIEGTPAAIRRPWLPDDLLAYTVVDDDPVEGVREGLALAEELDPVEIRATVEANYTWEAIAERYERLFADLVDGSRNA